MKSFRYPASRERGTALIIVVIILFFMVAVGFALYSVTGTNPNMAGNIRWHERVLYAAEAGVKASLDLLSQTQTSFQYRTTFGGATGLDDPLSPYYFRRLTDEQLVNDVATSTDNFLFASQSLPDDTRLTYTSFLVDPMAVNPASAHTQALMVCIGKGPQNTYVRLEIEF